MTNKSYERLMFVVGIVTGATLVGSYYERTEISSYRDGRKAGWEEAIAKCAEPSRLERAAKWVSQ